MFTKDTMQELGMEYVEPPRPLCGHPDATYLPAGKSIVHDYLHGQRDSGGWKQDNGRPNGANPPLSEKADVMAPNRPLPNWTSHHDAETVITNSFFPPPSLKAMMPPAYGNTNTNFSVRKTVPIFPDIEAQLRARQEHMQSRKDPQTDSTATSMQGRRRGSASSDPMGGGLKGGMDSSPTAALERKEGQGRPDGPPRIPIPTPSYSPAGRPPTNERPTSAHSAPTVPQSFSSPELREIAGAAPPTTLASSSVPLEQAPAPHIPGYAQVMPGPHFQSSGPLHQSFVQGPFIPEVQGQWPVHEMPVPQFAATSAAAFQQSVGPMMPPQQSVMMQAMPGLGPQGFAPPGYLPQAAVSGPTSPPMHQQQPQQVQVLVPHVGAPGLTSIGLVSIPVATTVSVSTPSMAPMPASSLPSGSSSTSGAQASLSQTTETATASATITTPARVSFPGLGPIDNSVPDKVYPGWVLPSASAQWRYDLPDSQVENIRLHYQQAMYAARAVRSFKDEMTTRFDPRRFARLYPEVRSGMELTGLVAVVNRSSPLVIISLFRRFHCKLVGCGWHAVGPKAAVRYGELRCHGGPSRKEAHSCCVSRAEAAKLAERAAKREEKKMKRQMEEANSNSLSLGREHLFSPPQGYPLTEGAAPMSRSDANGLVALFNPLTETKSGPPLSGFVPRGGIAAADGTEKPRRRRMVRVGRKLRGKKKDGDLTAQSAEEKETKQTQSSASEEETKGGGNERGDGDVGAEAVEDRAVKKRKMRKHAGEKSKDKKTEDGDGMGEGPLQQSASTLSSAPPGDTAARAATTDDIGLKRPKGRLLRSSSSFRASLTPNHRHSASSHSILASPTGPLIQLPRTSSDQLSSFSSTGSLPIAAHQAYPHSEPAAAIGKADSEGKQRIGEGKRGSLDGKLPWHKRILKIGKETGRTTPSPDIQFAGLLRRHREKLKSTYPQAQVMHYPVQAQQAYVVPTAYGYSYAPYAHYAPASAAPPTYGYVTQGQGYLPTSVMPMVPQASALQFSYYPGHMASAGGMGSPVPSASGASAGGFYGSAAGSGAGGGPAPGGASR